MRDVLCTISRGELRRFATSLSENLGKGGEHARFSQQVQVMRHCYGVAPVLKLTQYFCVRKLLARMRTAKPKQRAHKGGLAYVPHLQNILGDCRLRYRIANVRLPTLLVGDKRRRARIATKVQKLIKRKSKGIPAFA